MPRKAGFLGAALLFAAGCSFPGAAEADGRSVIVYGDSISLVGSPGGWPGELDQALDGRGGDWAVVNRAVNGGGLVWRTRCFGAPAAERLRSELAATADGDIIVLMAGVNDLIQPRLPKGYSTCFDPGELDAATLAENLAQLRQLASRHKRRLLLATIPPFGKSEFSSAAAEADRVAINRWIHANWPGGDVIDLDRALASKGDPAILDPAFDSGDGLHPNANGASTIARLVAGQIAAR